MLNCAETRTLRLVPLDLTDEERAAVIALLTEAPLDPNDLIAAIKRAMQRRIANSHNGGLAIQAALRNGYSWRGLAAETNIPQSTLRGWVTPPAEGRERRP